MSELADKITKGPEAELLTKIRRSSDWYSKALPAHVSADRFVTLALTEVRRRNLAECTPASVMASLMICAQLGLEPTGPLGHVYLVPFYDKRTKSKECTPIIGYRGEIELAYRSGLVSTIVARTVGVNDRFAFQYGSEERVSHEPDLHDPGDMTAVYAIATMRDGGQIPVVLSVDNVESYRARSKAADSGPWVTDYEAMARKTAVRRLAAFLPMTAEQSVAHAIDGARMVSVPLDPTDASSALDAIEADTIDDPDDDGVREGEVV